MAPKPVACQTCNESITKTQGSIECIICANWTHASFARLTDKDLCALKSMKSCVFICVECEPNINSNRSGGDGIMEEVRALNLKFDAFIAENKSELTSIRTTLEVMDSRFAETKKDIAKLDERISKIENWTTSKITSLEVVNNSLHRRLNRADLLISGLPDGLDDLVTPVVAVGAVFSVDVTKQDIHYATYINNGKQILVKFNSVPIRDAIMKAYFKTRKLRVCDLLNGEGNDVVSRVYLNDHFTPAASYLNSICTKLRRNNIIMKYKILNGDNVRAKLFFPDGSEAVQDTQKCVVLLKGPNEVNHT